MEFYPYLTFTGQAEQALTFYQHIFGGTMQLQRAGELFKTADVKTAELIVHGVLTVDDAFEITALDVIPGAPAVTPGNTVSMGIHTDILSEGQQLFDSLAEGGQIIIPFEKKAWGGTFGVLVDAFGVRWNLDA